MNKKFEDIKPLIDVIININELIEDKAINLHTLMKYHNISDDICLYLCRKIFNNSKTYDCDCVIYSTILTEYTFREIDYKSYPKTNEYIINLFHEYVTRNYCTDPQVVPFKYVSPNSLHPIVNRMCKFAYENGIILSDYCIFAIINLCIPDRIILKKRTVEKQKMLLTFIEIFLKYVDYTNYKKRVITDVVPLIDSYIERDSIKDMVLSDNRYLTTQEKQDLYCSLIREKDFRKLTNNDHA